MAQNFPVVSSEFRSANAGRPRSRIFGVCISHIGQRAVIAP